MAPKEKFLTSLREIVIAFTSADLDNQLDIIDSKVGDIIKQDKTITLEMADHYGQNIIGSASPVHELGDYVKRLERYTDVAAEKGYPEKALLWTIFVQFKKDEMKPSLVTEKLVESIQDLSAEDQTIFFKFIRIFQDETLWITESTQESRELERLSKALVASYPELQQKANLNNLEPIVDETNL